MKSQLPIVPEKQDLVDSLNKALSKGQISRRVFLKKLIAAGIAAPVAYSLLGEMVEPVAAQPLDDTQMLLDDNAALTRIATHPLVIEEILKIENAPPQNRQNMAQQFVARVQQDIVFRKTIGADIPDFRITTRVFEDPIAQRPLAIAKSSKEPLVLASRRGGSRRPRRFPPSPPITICASIGLLVCASWGA